MSLSLNVNLAIFIILTIFMCKISHADNNSTQKVPTKIVIPPFLEENIKVKEPMTLFLEWFNEALRKRDPDTYLAYLATVNKDGYPSLRPLALFDVDEEGFLFFTHHNSHKAMDIAENPNVAMTLFWKTLQRVVRIEGEAEKLTEEESLPIFRAKPRATQIRYLASPTSCPVPNREYLREREANITASLASDEPVPLPNWGGYIIIPNTIEFWQAQSDLVNDRIRFRRVENAEEEADGVLVHLGENGWVYERLAP